MFIESAAECKFTLIPGPFCFLPRCEFNHQANTLNMEENICNMTVNTDALLDTEDYESS